VTSAPRILVNDNATGTLESVDQEPFASVNASQTVTTTSLGGFVDAGTTINVTPHVSEAGYVQLEFEVILNSFTAPASANLPPPRQTNRVLSEATVPDGYTVIVGGLNTSNNSKSVRGIPYLEKIPVIKYLFTDRFLSQSRNSLFVFLRPVILKEDKFEQLKFFSETDLFRATEPSNYPQSQPLLMWQPPPSSPPPAPVRFPSH